MTSAEPAGGDEPAGYHGKFWFPTAPGRLQSGVPVHYPRW
jgi:hypothetical protein